MTFEEILSKTIEQTLSQGLIWWLMNISAYIMLGVYCKLLFLIISCSVLLACICISLAKLCLEKFFVKLGCFIFIPVFILTGATFSILLVLNFMHNIPAYIYHASGKFLKNSIDNVIYFFTKMSADDIIKLKENLVKMPKQCEDFESLKDQFLQLYLTFDLSFKKNPNEEKLKCMITYEEIGEECFFALDKPIANNNKFFLYTFNTKETFERLGNKNPFTRTNWTNDLKTYSYEYEKNIPELNSLAKLILGHPVYKNYCSAISQQDAVQRDEEFSHQNQAPLGCN